MIRESFSGARISKDSNVVAEQDPWAVFSRTFRTFFDSMIIPMRDIGCNNVTNEIDLAARSHDKRRLMLALIELRKHLLASGSEKPQGLFQKIKEIKSLAERSL